MEVVSMLTSNEIYYLSSAIDNKGVYGIDSMKALAKESVSPISAEESLINKKYINKDNSNGACYLKAS